MAQLEHRVLRNWLKRDADEREEIRDGDGAAFFFRRRDVLDEGVDGDDEKSAEDADEGEKSGDRNEAQAGDRENRGHHDEPEQSGDDHPLLDLSSGSVTCEKTSNTNAETESGEEIAAVLVVDAENVGGVEDD